MIRAGQWYSRVEANWNEAEPRRRTRTRKGKYAAEVVPRPPGRPKDSITPEECCRLMNSWRRA